MKINVNNKKMFNALLEDSEWEELVLFKTLIIGELKARVDETKCPACNSPILRYDARFCSFCGEEIVWIPDQEYFEEDVIIQ